MSTLRGTPRLRLPARARPGEVIELRMLIDHPMETGLHPGAPARDIIARVEVRQNDTPIFTADLGNGTAANPYHTLWVRLEETSSFTVIWTDEAGRSAQAKGTVRVG